MRISDWSSDVCSSDLEDGTLIWSQRDDMLDCAILLRPDEPLEPSLLVAYVGALGLGDALASTVPPGVEVNFGWPTRVAVNERDVGDIRIRVADCRAVGEVPEIGRGSWWERGCQYVLMWGVAV